MNEPTPSFEPTLPVVPDRPFERFDRSMPHPARIARAILEGFNRHYSLFRYVAQQAKSRFDTVHEGTEFFGRKAFVVDALDAVDDADVSRLGEERGVIHEAPGREQRIEAARLAVVA